MNNVDWARCISERVSKVAKIMVSESSYGARPLVFSESLGTRLSEFESDLRQLAHELGTTFETAISRSVHKYAARKNTSIRPYETGDIYEWAKLQGLALFGPRKPDIYIVDLCSETFELLAALLAQSGDDAEHVMDELGDVGYLVCRGLGSCAGSG